MSEYTGCCGGCRYFQDEDVNGWGICDYRDEVMHCGERCRQGEPKDEPKNELKMRESKEKACCIICNHFDVDQMRCTLPCGKMRGITLTDSLAEAENDCPDFDEAYYRLTPKGILSYALGKVGIEVEDDELSTIWREFEEGMIEAGYIGTKEE